MHMRLEKRVEDLIDHSSHGVPRFVHTIKPLPIPALIEQEMPLLTVIAREMHQTDDDVVALLPAARQLLRDAFDAIDGTRGIFA